MKPTKPRKIKQIVSIVCLFSLIYLLGCLTTAEDKRYELLQKILESGKKAEERASEYREHFLDCMDKFAIENSSDAAPATEIAEAAVSACQFNLDLYTMNQSRFYWSMATPEVRSLSGLYRIRADAEQKAQRDTYILERQGKQLAIGRLIRSRKILK